MRRIRAVMLLGLVCVVAMAWSIVFVNTKPAAREEVRASASALEQPGPPSTTTTIPTTTTAPPPTTTTTQAPVRAMRASPPASVVEAPPGGDDVFDRLADCESGRRNLNTGNGYYGYFQFLPSTWRSMGETGLPTDHSYAVQKAAAQRLVARSGWGQFPACSRKLGMR